MFEHSRGGSEYTDIILEEHHTCHVPLSLLVGVVTERLIVLHILVSQVDDFLVANEQKVECMSRSSLMNRDVLNSCPSHFPATLSRRALAISASEAPPRSRA